MSFYGEPPNPGTTNGQADKWTCLDCEAKGRGYFTHGDHWRATLHRIVWGNDPRAITTRRYSYDPDPVEQTMAHDGEGRR